MAPFSYINTTLPINVGLPKEVYNHTADPVPSFEPTSPIGSVQIAITICFISLCVSAIVGTWWLHLRKKRSTVNFDPSLGENAREVPSLRREVLDGLIQWWRNERTATGGVPADNRSAELRNFDDAPNLNSVKLTHPEVDLEMAMLLIEPRGRFNAYRGDGANMGEYQGLRGGELHFDENDSDADADSLWTPGQAWRYAHPGTRIL